MLNCCLETKCLKCCIETNMILSYHDIHSIQKLGYDRRFFVTERDGWLQLKNSQGRCVFHNGTHCTIYHHRPQGCSLYPVVYDKDEQRAILDDECPQRHCFELSKGNVKQLTMLVQILEKERTERIQKKTYKTSKTLKPGTLGNRFST